MIDNYWVPVVSSIFVILSICSVLIWFRMNSKRRNIAGRHVLVTGASNEIGKGIALGAAKLGANVTIVDRNKSDLLAVLQEMKDFFESKEQRANYISIDWNKYYYAAELMIKEAESKLGPVSVLVNCISDLCGNQSSNLLEDDFSNYRGIFFATKAAVKGMRKRRDGAVAIIGTCECLPHIYNHLLKFAMLLRKQAKSYGISVTLAVPPEEDIFGYNRESSKTKIISSVDFVALKILTDALDGKFLSLINTNELATDEIYHGMASTNTGMALSNVEASNSVAEIKVGEDEKEGNGRKELENKGSRVRLRKNDTSGNEDNGRNGHDDANQFISGRCGNLENVHFRNTRGIRMEATFPAKVCENRLDCVRRGSPWEINNNSEGNSANNHPLRCITNRTNAGTSKRHCKIFSKTGFQNLEDIPFEPTERDDESKIIRLDSNCLSLGSKERRNKNSGRKGVESNIDGEKMVITPRGSGRRDTKVGGGDNIGNGSSEGINKVGVKENIISSKYAPRRIDWDFFDRVGAINSPCKLDIVYETLVKVNGKYVKPKINTFEELRLNPTLLKNIREMRYEHPTPLQKYCVPIMIDKWDVMATAQNDSGKTDAFLIPILGHLIKGNAVGVLGQPYALIICHSRESVGRICLAVRKLSRGTNVQCSPIYGGVSASQQRSDYLKIRAHIVVATLGRLKDFVSKGFVGFDFIRFVVLDEVDRIFDDRVIRDLKYILDHPRMPKKRQTAMFSATFSDYLQILAKRWLRENYVFVSMGVVGKRMRSAGNGDSVRTWTFGGQDHREALLASDRNNDELNYLESFEDFDSEDCVKSLPICEQNSGDLLDRLETAPSFDVLDDFDDQECFESQPASENNRDDVGGKRYAQNLLGNRDLDGDQIFAERLLVSDDNRDDATRGKALSLLAVEGNGDVGEGDFVECQKNMDALGEYDCVKTVPVIEDSENDFISRLGNFPVSEDDRDDVCSHDNVQSSQISGGNQNNVDGKVGIESNQ